MPEKIIYLLMLPLLLFLGFAVKKEEYKFVFTQIDNQVLIVVNDSTVFDSGKFDFNPDIAVDVSITEYLQVGDNKITVKLINYNETDCLKNPWAIAYEFFKDLDPIDYQEENSDGIKDCGGIKFEHTYYITLK